MNRLFSAYKRLLRSYPLGIQAVQAGFLMGLGDQIAQNFVEKRSIRDLDLVRTAKFAFVGFGFVGPATRTWYGVLDKRFGSKGVATVLKKVACDQLLFAPAFILVLLSVIAGMQGNDFNSIKLKLEDEYPDILLNNYKLWPAVQLINFYLVPLHYQVLFVQSVAIVWNTYISYRTNKESSKSKDQ